MSKQKLSFQEQLLKTGLVTSAQAKAAKSTKNKQTQLHRKNNVAVVDEAKKLALNAQAEKVERDKELNRVRKQHEEKKALAAQLKQMIELNRYPHEAVGEAYHFSDQQRMKTVYVSEKVRQQLVSGQTAIVKYDLKYELVSREVAQKIAERDAEAVIVLNEAVTEGGGDDPYAAFQVPDDLIW
ncbi:MAG: DUF2058 domain-containing protein [Methylovulum sp.]|jgi:uncharacterized protein YaiL (DUF2058 family)|nr:DUF2058 domain-containing protein [Methylovulum sp.]